MSKVRHNIRRTTGDLKMKINGKLVDIYLAKITYKCIHCLGDLELYNAGVRCKENSNHYGFIHRDEASKFSQEERHMKIGEMFPSDYLRGIDVIRPMKMKIVKVISDRVKDRDGRGYKQENILMFEGLAKKLRLNLEMSKEIHFFILGLSPDDDVDQKWPGNWVTVYQTTADAFGKTHIVPRVRKITARDKVYPEQAGGEKALNTLNRSEFWARAKRDIGLPVVVSKFILIQEGLDDEYKPENADKIWKILNTTGRKFDEFLDQVIKEIPYFTSKEMACEKIQKMNVSFIEDEADQLMMNLDQFAMSQADIENDNDEQIILTDIFTDAPVQGTITEEDFP